MRRPTFTIRALVLVALAAAACTQGPATSGGASTTSAGSGAQPAGTGGSLAGSAVDACSVLTDADIKEITGYAVASRKAGPAQGIYPNGCEWELSNGGAASWQIVLGVVSPGGRAYYDRYLGPYVEGSPVPGLADENVQADLTGTISAVKGDTLVDVQYVAFGVPDDVTARLVQRAFDNIAR